VGQSAEDLLTADPVPGEVDQFRRAGVGLGWGELAEGTVRPGCVVADETSDAVKLSSCCGKFLRGVREGDGLVVVLAGGQAAVEAAEEPPEEVALGGGVACAENPIRPGGSRR
jgi:hypothetical protein